MDDRYVAGLFDGEGWVRISRWKKPNSTHVRYQLTCGIGMAYRPIIEALAKEYGGSVHNNRHDLRSPKNRIQFMWTIASQKAIRFLNRIYPYLVVKRDEAKIAIAFQNHVDSTPYIRTGRRGTPRGDSENIRTIREKMFRDIYALKKRSFPPIS